MSETTSEPHSPRRIAGLALLALGVVFGDIGTSPLYAVRECFTPPHGVTPEREAILGVLSLIIWSLVLVVGVKYLAFVLRADNHGEGGILALLALLKRRRARGQEKEREQEAARTGRAPMLVLLGLFGAALLYGDGMITPAISVLSAVEGLKLATPVFEPYVVPITVAILIGLFAVQSTGTSRIGSVFGPVMLVWFATIATLGVISTISEPAVLASVDPRHAVRFFADHGLHGFLVLGTVFLVVTGGEALYADMGHFGRAPIRWAWFACVFAALLCNYLGQGALLLRNPSAPNPFFALAPQWALYPLIALATVATVIASQALISGVFSLAMQAVQLGYFPRLQIEHTSETQRGQIFIAPINWSLMVASIGLVVGFGSASKLAAAYGVAVTVTMAITTALFHAVARQRWKWSAARTWPLTALFLVVDLAFLGANLAKIPQGGWFPLVVAALVFVLMTTWQRGRTLVGERLRRSVRPMRAFLRALEYDKPARVSGTAIFMTSNLDGVPLALLHNMLHNKVVHQRVVLLSIGFEPEPYVEDSDRLEVEEIGHGFHRVVASYGFMEEPDVRDVLARCAEHGLALDANHCTFFLGRETLVPRPHKHGFALWRQRLFSLMARNAQPAVNYFRIPPHRVIEIGQQIEL